MNNGCTGRERILISRAPGHQRFGAHCMLHGVLSFKYMLITPENGNIMEYPDV